VIKRKRLILSIDQGTTGTKVLLIDQTAQVVGQGFQEHTQSYPQPGWVEHDPAEIFECIKVAVVEAMSSAQATPQDIIAVGLANQGETVTAWSAATGKPLSQAIVWSCRRTAVVATAWEQDDDWANRILAKTGLRIDAYFSATKFCWLLDNVAAIAPARKDQSLRLGTLDTWLLYCMSGSRNHLTDPSTAARTLLYNIHTGEWDAEVLEYLDIPASALAQIRPTLGEFGYTDPAAFLGICAPVLVSQVDQPAALYGHLCFGQGDAKCTYGTGCFLYVNTGEQVVTTQSGILSTVVWHKGKAPIYALESGVYTAGTAMKWLLQLGLIYEESESENLAASIAHTAVKFIPALTGMAAPYWDSEARGAFLGLTTAAGRADLVRAVLEGIAHRVADSVEAINPHLSAPLSRLRVDGGMTQNAFLMQFQADLLGIPIEVANFPNVTAQGIGFLVGEGLGWWQPEDLLMQSPQMQIYAPKQSDAWRQIQRQDWHKAVATVRQYR
jgi:glycerol kinase